MSGLSPTLRRAPRLLYLIAIVWVIWRMALPYAELLETGWADGMVGDRSIVKFAMLERFGRAVFDAFFLVAAGINAQLLIAIFDRMPQPEQSLGAAE